MKKDESECGGKMTEPNEEKLQQLRSDDIRMNHTKSSEGLSSRGQKALTCIKQNHSIFPIKPNGKEPLTPNGYKDASKDDNKIREWWRKNPEANIGIATGKVSDLIVIDADIKDDENGIETLNKLEATHGSIKTLKVKTPSGGQHLYFKSPKEEIRNRVRFLPGLDVRGDGGYVIAPNSEIDGKQYLFINDCEVADIPPWLLNIIQRKNTEQFNPDKALTGVPEGERNHTIFRYASSLRARGISFEEAKVLALKAAENCDPPLDSDETLSCLNSAWEYSENERCTDLGNSRRLVAKFNNDIIYVTEFRKWHYWNGNHWVVDSDGQIVRYAKETVRQVYVEAGNEEDDDWRRNLRNHATKSESEARIKAMIGLAKSELGIPVSQIKLDSNQFLIGVANGVIDLRIGKLKMKTVREDYITKQSLVIFDQSARCPKFTEFLNQIMDGNKALIGFLKRAIGYSLTGSTTEQCLFLLYGVGANGKTTLLNIILKLLGNYAAQTQPETLMARRDRSATNDIARLRGKRFVATSETEEGKHLAEAMIKQLTGGDFIAARFLYAEYFEFVPTFKIWLASNHKPVIKGDDYAIWRRIHLIPFAVTFTPDKQDRNLQEKLERELPGILNWAIEGCLEWQSIGLKPSEEVIAATNEYRSEMDVINAWIEECCALAENQSAKVADLYNSYKKYSEENDLWTMKKNKFGRKLLEHGFTREKTPHIVYRGIGLLG